MINLDNIYKRAEHWKKESDKYMEISMRNFQNQITTMLDNPREKALLIELLDISFRSNNYGDTYKKIKELFQIYGVPKFLSAKDTRLVKLFLSFGGLLPSVSLPMFIKTIKKNTKDVVIGGEVLEAHLRKRYKEGISNNINQIGEIVIGEEEAEERIQLYLKTLELPYVNYISLKISTIYSQISPIASEKTIEQLVKQLTRIFEKAMNTKDQDGQPKFVNLDMEEYKDVYITYELFTRTLSQDQFKNYRAGIVLQTYLPDSMYYYEKLLKWSKARVKNGGSPIKVRIVKGANMEMELTEAKTKHWELATFGSKLETDSHYKKVLQTTFEGDNLDYIKIGVASHNIFDISFAYELLSQRNILKKVDFEMLEGINMATTYAISKEDINCLLYAPTCTEKTFINAIGYLVRRFDENTSNDNFLRYSFDLEVGSKNWNLLKKRFEESLEKMKEIDSTPKRKQNRLKEKAKKNDTAKKYIPEVDTDFVLQPNIEWASGIRDKWSKIGEKTTLEIPTVIAGKEKTTKNVKEVYDKSQGVCFAKVHMAEPEDIALAVETAKKDLDGWRTKSVADREKILLEVAQNFRASRGDLIGIAAAELGKVFTETDVEVSEAIDFVHFYIHSVIDHTTEYPNVKMEGKGVGVVISPWNFPIAIPVGGVVASLASGNTTIIKASSDSMVCAYYLCKCFWDAGVSKNTLQLVHCSGSQAGQYLVASKDVDFVILTGGEDTADRMYDIRPDLFLSAETGGKNATIISKMADREQGIKNVCNSAFLNSGQKCSATSILLLQEEVYNTPSIQKTLKDAAESLKTGSVWDLSNKISTLSNPPSGKLKEALEKDESSDGYWLVPPSYAENNKAMLRPSIRWGVDRGGFFHKNELFGPVLSVMSFKTLDEAIDIIHETGYGLTSGLETLDKNEKIHWLNRIECGNLYINRQTTGAIVLRQPFGGMKKSAVGSGRKAGSYNYVTQFLKMMEVKDPTTPKITNDPILDGLKSLEEKLPKRKQEIQRAYKGAASYINHKKNTFEKAKDYFAIRGEDNICRYKPVKNTLIIIEKEDTFDDILLMVSGAVISGGKVTLSSLNKDLSDAFVEFVKHKEVLGYKGSLVYQDVNSVVKDIEKYDRIRIRENTHYGEALQREANKKNVFIAKGKPMLEGRFELLNYHIEQTISNSYHRYGNIEIRHKIMDFDIVDMK